jgi:hypothetical protein
MEEGEEKERKKEREKRKEERKKIAMRKEGFLRTGPALLAVQGIAAVRCN